MEKANQMNNLNKTEKEDEEIKQLAKVHNIPEAKFKDMLNTLTPVEKEFAIGILKFTLMVKAIDDCYDR